ncbi:hypothetical protein [Komagataeibacter xylinus]|uniref:hypothetical protein n=1 Tax=Komagataeibacter xylinus TaxID=28448 RepID=UPI001F100437|nr:hypothetical protein [Komagataeibacter xylinus]
MANIDVQKRLREHAVAMTTQAATRSVLLWLTEHHDAVAAIRPPGGSWKPVIAVMRESGLDISADHSGLRKVRKLWVQVRNARKGHAEEQTASVEVDPPVHTTHPSRLPQDWKPDLVDDGQKNLPPSPMHQLYPHKECPPKKTRRSHHCPRQYQSARAARQPGRRTFPLAAPGLRPSSGTFLRD